MRHTVEPRIISWREEDRREQYIKAKRLIAEIEAYWEYEKHKNSNSSIGETRSSNSSIGKTRGDHPSESEDRLLTTKEAARTMSVCPKTVSRLRDNGKIQPVKEYLPLIRYRLSDILKLPSKKKGA